MESAHQLGGQVHLAMRNACRILAKKRESTAVLRHIFHHSSQRNYASVREARTELCGIPLGKGGR